ncbi:MAG: hypothetical protein V1928_01950 [Parcubacteria group bacterium]
MIIYQEKIHTYLFLKIFLGASLIIFILIAGSRFTAKPVHLNHVAEIALWILLIMNAIALFSFNKLEITVTEEKINFGFGKFKKSFYLVNVQSVEIGKYKFGNYWGYGIRMGSDGAVGYVPRAGSGLKIKFKNDPRSYFISTAKPEELKNIITNKSELARIRHESI